jgi:NAD(P)H dehydrogenase (quinone)
MNALIVFAHPDPSRSFNAALRDVAVRTLTESGHQVEVSDLYAMEFKAVGDAGDFDPKGYADDVKAEMRKFEKADLIIFNFPLWWYSAPAILKGWIDRVFASGFAYGGGRGVYAKGPFKGKRAMVAMTTGSLETSYGENNISGSMSHILFHLHHGVFWYVGMDVLKPFIAYGPSHISEADRMKYLDDYKQRLKTIFSESKMEKLSKET